MRGKRNHNGYWLCGPIAALSLMLVLSACQSTQVPEASLLEEPGDHAPLVRATLPVRGNGISVGVAAEMSTLLTPYREELKVTWGEVVGESALAMENRSPELANLIVDAIRTQHNREYPERPVDVLFTNLGSLRSPLPAGEITRGTILSILPFENTLILISMTGREMEPLAQALAQAGGGFPFSGVEIEVRGSDVVILKDGAPIDPDATYLVGTNDYLASGIMTVLDAYPQKPDTGLLFREFITAYISELAAQGRKVDVTSPTERIHYRHD